MTILEGWKKIKLDYVLDFMSTIEYIDMPFINLVDKFNLSGEDLIYLLEKHTGDAPLSILRWTDEEIAIG